LVKQGRINKRDAVLFETDHVLGPWEHKKRWRRWERIEKISRTDRQYTASSGVYGGIDMTDVPVDANRSSSGMSMYTDLTLDQLQGFTYELADDTARYNDPDQWFNYVLL
jgi:hypothetical protein